ncbi:ribosome maturation factor RimM [Treponema sp.]|uniref:ribosome maturation factor RimM n=1 Tax=Treponema sp. TaxID=166 RepID=UPI00298E13B7|nr:ribosome maturation factor RimM [Treponema sp.]MCR5614383.1 ribosome maturation factor RimM [Treponema sp.]
MAVNVNFDDQLTVGFVRGTHGLTGEFKVESASGEYEHIAALKEVTLRKDEQQKVFLVEKAEAAGSTLYMKLKGVDTPEEAKKLNGWDIRVARQFAAPLQKDEWYIADLVKCTLVYEGKDGLAGKETGPIEIGKITDVLEGGAGDLLEVSLSESCNILADDIKKTSSGKPRKVLVPLNKEHIGKVDMKTGTIQLMHLWILE